LGPTYKTRHCILLPKLIPYVDEVNEHLCCGSRSDILHWSDNGMKWGYNGVVLRLLKDLLRTCDAVRRGVLNCSFDEFGVPLKLSGLSKMCSYHTNSNIRRQISSVWERHYRTDFAFKRELRTEEFVGEHYFFSFFVFNILYAA
jgi:hypothetical protein